MRSYVAGFLLIAVAMSGPRAASADGRTATLQRAVSNTLMGPLDVALSPVVTAQTLYARCRADDYSWPATVAMTLLGGPGFFFPSNAAAGCFRIWAGLFELPLGVGMLVARSFTEWEPPELFEISEAPALVDHPNAILPIKFGVQYLGRGGGE
jgi:hypothetical protein